MVTPQPLTSPPPGAILVFPRIFHVTLTGRVYRPRLRTLMQPLGRRAWWAQRRGVQFSVSGACALHTWRVARQGSVVQWVGQTGEPRPHWAHGTKDSLTEEDSVVFDGNYCPRGRCIGSPVRKHSASSIPSLSNGHNPNVQPALLECREGRSK